MHKKAQGQIITTVLIILLVLAAIVIVWQVVQNTVSSGGEQIEAQSVCIGITVEVTNVDTTPSAADVVTVRRGQGSTATSVTGYKVFVDGVNVHDETGLTEGPLDTEVVTTTVDISSGDKVSAAAIVGETVCSAGIEYTVP